MQNESAKPARANKRRTMTKADALEMLSSDMAELERAGVVIEHESANGVITLRIHGATYATDSEGVYFVPCDEPAPEVVTLPEIDHA